MFGPNSGSIIIKKVFVTIYYLFYYCFLILTFCKFFNTTKYQKLESKLKVKFMDCVEKKIVLGCHMTNGH